MPAVDILAYTHLLALISCRSQNTLIHSFIFLLLILYVPFLAYCIGIRYIPLVASLIYLYSTACSRMLAAKTMLSPQEPGCEWINAPTEWLQPSEWPERAARDPRRPDPCALIKQLIPRRQVACLLAEWHYVVDAWSYGTSKTYSLHVWTHIPRR